MRRIDFYRVKRGVNLANPNFWNPILEDLDLRLAAREDDAEDIASALTEVESLALTWLGQTFTPLILDAQERLNTIGVSFLGVSTTEQAIVASGTLIFNLTEESAANFVFTDYVNISAAGASPIATMKATVTSYNRTTRDLTVAIISNEGSGTYSNWNISFGLPPEAGGHADLTNNPHLVTAAQVGAYTTAQIDAMLDALADDIIGQIPQGTFGDMFKAENLAGLTNVTTAQNNLGLGSFATKNVPTQTTVTDQATVVWNLGNRPMSVSALSLGATRAMGAPTNLGVGFHVLKIKQPASGGPHGISTWNAAYKFPGGVAPVLSTAANAEDILSFVCDGTSMMGTFMNSVAQVA